MKMNKKDEEGPGWKVNKEDEEGRRKPNEGRRKTMKDSDGGR